MLVVLPSKIGNSKPLGVRGMDVTHVIGVQNVKHIVQLSEGLLVAIEVSLKEELPAEIAAEGVEIVKHILGDMRLIVYIVCVVVA